MLATSDLVALINSNPDGMTTAQVATAFNVDALKAAHRLGRSKAYGLLVKRQADGKTAALWLPKVKAATP